MGTHLRIDIQNTLLPTLLLNRLDSLDARPVHVATELGVLDESALVREVDERFPRRKVVRRSVYFSGARGTGGVCEEGLASCGGEGALGRWRR